MKLLKRNELDKTLLSKGFLVSSVIIHILFILSLFFGFLNPFFHDSTYCGGQGIDFFGFYQAGYNVMIGLSPYEYISRFVVVPYFNKYRYLPFFAFTFGIILNLFPPRIAYWVWVFFILILIWYACWITYRICISLNKPKWVSYIAIGMWLCFSPIYVELYMGQATLFVALLTFFSFYAESRKKEKEDIFLWTLGSLIKLMPYLLIPAILGTGRTRKVIYNILLSILAIIAFGFIYFFYFLYFNLEATTFFFPTGGNFDLKNIIYVISKEITHSDKWFINYVDKNITYIFLVTFFGLSTLATIYSKDYLVNLSLFACSYFLAFSGIWEHHFTFILPFLILLWIRDNNRKSWFLIFILLALPTPFYIFETLNLWDFPFYLLNRCTKNIPMMVLFILLMKKAYENPRQETFKGSINDFFNSIYIGLKTPEMKKFPNVFT
ncbi:MAG: glycosyltransferase family 87 protein [Promethearchaeota archaeon]